MLNETNPAKGWVKGARLGVSLIALSFLANCSPPPPVDMPKAPPLQDYSGRHSQAPTAEDNSGLLGGPAPGAATVTATKSSGLTRFRRPDGVLVVTMRPIANPGESAFGAHSPARKPAAAPRMAPEHVAHAATHRPAPTVARAPAAVAVRPAAPRPVAVKPAAPKIVAPPPAPVIKPIAPPQVVAKPVVPAAPVIVPKDVTLAAPKIAAPIVALSQGVRIIPALASTDPRLAGLQSDVLPALTEGAKFVVADGVAKGQAGPVTLTLPKSFYSEIREKAARHGLDRFAKQTNVTATLTGEGYQIVPDGAQTIELSDDKDTVFTWQVIPQPVNRGPLHVDLGANLVGGSNALALPLAGLEPRGDAATAEAAETSGKKQFQLPGLSPSTSKSVTIAGLLMVGIACLAFAARRANDDRREDERRRRQRESMMFAPPEPPKAETPPPYIEPPHIEPPPPPAPIEPPPAPPAPSVASTGDGRSIVQVIAEAVSDLRDGDGKEPPKA